MFIFPRADVLYRTSAWCLAVGITVTAMTSIVDAQPVTDINGLFENPYVVQNDFGSSATIDTTGFPASASIHEDGFIGCAPPCFNANRHDLLFSNDMGASPRLFGTYESFDISVDITLDVGSASPRKESGLRVNNNGFDGLFIINSDAQEIVAFGGALPFYNFNTTYGIQYDVGETINLRMIYNAPDSMDPANNPGNLEYRVDLASDAVGPYSSGPITFSNLEFGLIPNSEIGVYAQASGNSSIPTDFITATFQSFDFDGPDSLTCDFDSSGTCDGADINALSAVSAAMSNDPLYDLNGDNVVNDADVGVWLVEGGAANPATTGGNPFLRGDANLDGIVDGQDFIEWNSHKFSSDTAWTGGNFNGDAITDGQDFIAWNSHKFMSSSSSSFVPEPATTPLIVIMVLTLGLRPTRRLP